MTLVKYGLNLRYKLQEVVQRAEEIWSRTRRKVGQIGYVELGMLMIEHAGMGGAI